MTKLKNITSSSVSLLVFNTPDPVVGNVSKTAVLTLQPLEVVDEAGLLVVDTESVNYNADLIDNLIIKGVLTRLP